MYNFGHNVGIRNETIYTVCGWIWLGSNIGQYNNQILRTRESVRSRQEGQNVEVSNYDGKWCDQ